MCSISSHCALICNNFYILLLNCVLISINVVTCRHNVATNIGLFCCILHFLANGLWTYILLRSQNNSRFYFLHIIWGVKRRTSTYYFSKFSFLNKNIDVKFLFRKKKFWKIIYTCMFFFTPQITCKKLKRVYIIFFWQSKKISLT